MIRACGDGPRSLLRGGAAEPNPELRRESRPVRSLRVAGVQRRHNLGDMRVARTEEIILAQMAEFRSHFLRHGRVIVDDQCNAGPICYEQNLFRQATNLLGQRLLGAKLNQVRTPIAKLLRNGSWRAPAQVSRIYKGVKPAFL